MTSTTPPWEDTFPIHEEFEDAFGNLRSFVITCHATSLGFTIRAEEPKARGIGYQFYAFSEAGIATALARVRYKVRRGLATRHVTESAGGISLLHDVLRGRITTDDEGEPLLIVDGRPVTFSALSAILETHEGWEFELRIIDSLK